MAEIHVLPVGVGAFLLATMPLLLVPGGGFALLLRWVLRDGQRGGLLVASGSLAALAAQLLVVVGALDALSAHTRQYRPILDLAGAGITILLGARSMVKGLSARAVRVEERPTTGPGAALESFGIGVLNPKGLLVYAVLAPRFLQPGWGGRDLVLLGTAHLLLVAAWLATLVACATRVVGRTTTSRRQQLEVLCGAVLLGYGLVWLGPVLQRWAEAP